MPFGIIAKCDDMADAGTNQWSTKNFTYFINLKLLLTLYPVLISCAVLLPTNLSHNLYAAVHGLTVFEL